MRKYRTVSVETKCNVRGHILYCIWTVSCSLRNINSKLGYTTTSLHTLLNEFIRVLGYIGPLALIIISFL